MAQADSIQLIVGLGNPGQKYSSTRHNAGFWFLDLLARQFHADFRTESKFKGEVASFNHNGERVWLLKPATFMNLSGESLGPFARFYQIAPENILVVHDEIDLPPGTVRFKKGGGHGGNNGLRSIFSHFSKEFWRLRIGVGHPGDRDQVISYVTQTPSAKDRQLIDESIDKAMETMPDVLAGDMGAAMQILHQKPNQNGF